MRDRLSGHEGVSRATEIMMHSRQGRNRRLSEDEHASDAPDRGGRQQAPEKSSSPSSPAGSWAFSNGNGRNKSPSREERASDAHPQGGGSAASSGEEQGSISARWLEPCCSLRYRRRARIRHPQSGVPAAGSGEMQVSISARWL